MIDKDENKRGILKTWKEKLETTGRKLKLPMKFKIKGKLSKRWGTGTCVIADPKEIDAIMKRVPKGKLITINQIRAKLAKKHKANIACPITTGIFARIAAEAAAENAKAGKKFTPYWRTLKERGVINEKYPGGVMGQKKLLEKEKHKVTKKGKKYVVADFEKHLLK